MLTFALQWHQEKRERTYLKKKKIKTFLTWERNRHPGLRSTESVVINKMNPKRFTAWHIITEVAPPQKKKKRKETNYMQGNFHKTFSWLCSRNFASQKGEYIQSEERKKLITKNILPDKVIILLYNPVSFPGGSAVKNLPANAGDVYSILGSGYPLDKEMATHSSILAWKIPWTEEPGEQVNMGSQRVRYDLATKQQQQIQSSNLLLGIFLKKTKIWKDMWTPMFIAALFRVAKRWEQLKCPSIEECTKIMECYATQPHKEGNLAICDNVGWPRRYYGKWSQRKT